MTSPFGPMRVIVNPRAGRGAVERGWPEAERVLRDGEVEFDARFTEDAGHATVLAREAFDEGIRYVVAVGGDGTINEVVNGLMDDDGPLDPETVLGVVAAGSGSDFVRTFGLPHAPAQAAAHLLGKNVWGSLDVPSISFVDADGQRRSRWFANIAEAGIGASVVDAAARMPRWLGGRAYRLAAVRAVATYRPTEAHLVMNARAVRRGRRDAPLEETTWSGPVTMAVFANGQFFGGGLRVAPRAIPSDATLDVLVGHGTKGEAVRALRRMPRGEHVPDATIEEYLADRIVMDGPQPLAVEADGELLGTTPITIEVCAGALRLKI